MKLLDQIRSQKQADNQARLYREVLRKAAQIGGQLFGPVNDGGRRDFFCLDEHTVVWHEEWLDTSGQRKVMTTRYDLRPNGILKTQDGHGYHYIGLEESLNLCNALSQYKQRLGFELQRS